MKLEWYTEQSYTRSTTYGEATQAQPISMSSWNDWQLCRCSELSDINLHDPYIVSKLTANGNVDLKSILSVSDEKIQDFFPWYLKLKIRSLNEFLPNDESGEFHNTAEIESLKIQEMHFHDLSPKHLSYFWGRRKTSRGEARRRDETRRDPERACVHFKPPGCSE